MDLSHADLDAAYGRARRLLEGGQIERAVDILSGLIILAPRFHYQRLLGVALQRWGKSHLALLAYADALHHKPDDIACLTLAAECVIDSGYNLDNAREALRFVLSSTSVTPADAPYVVRAKALATYINLKN